MEKDEARAVADALLEKERGTGPKRRVRRVPLLIRSADSVRLGRERGWELYCQVRRNIFAAQGASLAFAAAPLVLLLLFWAFMRHPVSVWYLMAFDVSILAPFFLLWLHVRKELVRLARMQK